MRVIAGKLGGRTFDSPQTELTHPMSDKIRGALFNILGDIEGLQVVDVFAGSGALSFEAISRGAVHVTAIESDHKAQATIRSNIMKLGLADQITLVSTTAQTWLQTTAATFDVVLLDPPYDNRQEVLIVQLMERVSQGGLAVLSWPTDVQPPSMPHMNCVMQRTYGDAQLLFYRR